MTPSDELSKYRLQDKWMMGLNFVSMNNRTDLYDIATNSKSSTRQYFHIDQKGFELKLHYNQMKMDPNFSVHMICLIVDPCEDFNSLDEVIEEI